MIGPLPTTSIGQTQDRAIGVRRRFLGEILDFAEFLGAASENVSQVKSALHLYPTSQNEGFGAEVVGIVALLSGGGKTGRKVNEKAYLSAKEAYDWIDRVLK